MAIEKKTKKQAAELWNAMPRTGNVVNLYEQLMQMANMEWVALSVQLKGVRIALHSKNAPKRPRGIA